MRLLLLLIRCFCVATIREGEKEDDYEREKDRGIVKIFYPPDPFFFKQSRRTNTFLDLEKKK